MDYKQDVIDRLDDRIKEIIGEVSPEIPKKKPRLQKRALPSNNDKCVCGSGKKYKKCCKQKEIKLDYFEQYQHRIEVYLRRFPNGEHAEDARDKLSKLNNEIEHLKRMLKI